MTYIKAQVWERDLTTPGPPTFVCHLPKSKARKWRDAVSQPGAGELTVKMDDTDLAELTHGRIVRFYEDSIPTGNVSASASAAEAAILIEPPMRMVFVAPGEENEQTCTVQGRGLLAVLEEAVVYPDRTLDIPTTATVRRFDFSSSAFDDSSWGAAVETTQAGNFGPPGNWHNQADGQWIWSEDSTAADVPAGDCYLRNTFVLADDTVVGIYLAGDDLYETYINNELITELCETNFYTAQSHRAQIPLKAGTHVIAIKATNVNVARAGIKLAAYEMDENEQPGTLLFESDDTWKALGYPSEPPGFTVGQVLRILFAEAYLRGCILDVGVTFGDVYDTGGDPYGITSDITVPIGATFLDVVLQLAETYIDVHMDPALGLSVWNKGSMGAASGLTFAAGDNLTHYELSSEGGRLVNAILAGHQTGHREVEDSASIAAHGRMEDYLSLGDVTSMAEVDRIGVATFADVAETYWTIRAAIRFTAANRPYVGINIGDAATAPGEDGSPTDVRLMALTVSEDENGLVSYAPELVFT